VGLDERIVGHRSGESEKGVLSDHHDADHDPENREGPAAEDQESLDPSTFNPLERSNA
jgi:hypothetical protein